ncbi:protein TRANSPORT INHIBITOR RESPONSE 1-like [Wolffia australiana]
MATPAFPDEVWDFVFSFLSADADRNAISLVCRAWHRLDRLSRPSLSVANCYSVLPSRALRRFLGLRSVSIKGKPHFADFNLVPDDWGASAIDWVAALAQNCPLLEHLRMKRMVVSDDCLEMISRAFRNFRTLILDTCEGFSTVGLAYIAANCRNLRELNLQENNVEDWSGHWLSHFPENLTSLVSLNIACLDGHVNLSTLERLLRQNPNFETLRLNQAISPDRLATLLRLAPRITDLGTGRFLLNPALSTSSNLESAFASCKNLRSLSGIWDRVPPYLQAILPICHRLTSLNLSYASLQSLDLIKLVSRSSNLRQLWVMDLIEDDGLEAVAANCRYLEDLRVFPSDPYGQVAPPPAAVTERGLVAVAAGCPRLNSVLYFCRQMTNAALEMVAQSRPNLVKFRLCIMEPRVPDYKTGQPLDTGFAAVVESCCGLRRLSMSGLLTNRVFAAIGSFARQLEMLSVAFAGDGDEGLNYVLSGCPRLRKLEIRDCPFGDKALLGNAKKLETMRSLWMSSCLVTIGGCKELARMMPHLSVEAIEETKTGSPEVWPNDALVEKLYVYRTLAGPRQDAPDFVWIL